MKTLAYLAIAAAALVTIALGLKATSSPPSLGALGFIVWALSPYAYMFTMAKLVDRKVATIVVIALVVLASAFGIWVLVDVMFIHPDAQGGLVFVAVPVWQWAFLLLATLPVYFLNRKRNT